MTDPDDLDALVTELNAGAYDVDLDAATQVRVALEEVQRRLTATTLI